MPLWDLPPEVPRGYADKLAFVCVILSVWRAANNMITYPDVFSHNENGRRQPQGLVQLLALESAEEVAGRKARCAGGRHSR